MNWWEAALLGLVQGLAEFLPVSSSGHLVLGQYLLGVQQPGITFEVLTHFGTTLAIITVYWKRIGVVLRDGFAGLRRPGAWREALRPGRIERQPGDELAYDPPPSGGEVASLRLLLLVFLTMIPTGLVYVLFKDSLEAAFTDPRLVCGMLLVTGTLLLLLRLRPHPNGRLSIPKALVVGLAQGAAMIPGISRSGATICAGIYQNVDRKEAADFSFLMLLPVIIGATLLEVMDLFETSEAVNWGPILLGTAVAYASGVWAIRAVLSFVQQGNLHYFAFYCYAVGLLGLLLISP
jgi:undecaprenyl-diphosphatase